MRRLDDILKEIIRKFSLKRLNYLRDCSYPPASEKQVAGLSININSQFKKYPFLK